MLMDIVTSDFGCCNPWNLKDFKRKLRKLSEALEMQQKLFADQQVWGMCGHGGVLVGG